MELTGEQAYLFRHAVVRDAAYALQVPSERAALHGVALALLEAIPGLNRAALGLELAQHARLAAEFNPRFAAIEREYLKLGGDFARFNYDYPGALAAFERLHGLLANDPPARAIVADMLADVLQRLGRWEDSLAFFEEVRRHAEGLEHVGRAIVHLAWVGMDMGRQVDDLVAEGEALAGRADSHRLRIAFMMLRARQAAGRGEDPGAIMRRVIEYAHNTGDIAQEFIGRMNAAQYAATAGDEAGASAHLAEAERLCAGPSMRHHRVAMVLQRAEAAIRAGDWPASLRYAYEAATAGLATGSRGLVGAAWVNIAVAQTGLGQFADAFHGLEETRPIIAETADVTLALSWLRAYARLMEAWDKPHEAVPVLEEGLRELAGRAPQAALDELAAALSRFREAGL